MSKLVLSRVLYVFFLHELILNYFVRIEACILLGEQLASRLI